MKERIVTFPYMGEEYTLCTKRALESLGLKIVLPPKINDRTIKLGVRYSADMMCFPYKTTLGNFIEALEKGANTLLMYDSCGQCRLKHYFKLHELTLKQLGYEFEIYPISKRTVIPTFKKLSGRSIIKVIIVIKNLVREIREIDERRYRWDKEKMNIGIIGEIYTCCEERVNYEIEKKLKELKVNPYNTANLSDFIHDGFKFLNIFRDEKRKYKKIARTYLNKKLGGHGLENIYNLLWMIDLKLVDGVIHLLPLSCMPEATVEPIINKICQDNNIPLLRIMIDETNSEQNVNTRVETFVELIKRKADVKNEMLVRN